MSIPPADVLGQLAQYSSCLHFRGGRLSVRIHENATFADKYHKHQNYLLAICRSHAVGLEVYRSRMLTRFLVISLEPDSHERQYYVRSVAHDTTFGRHVCGGNRITVDHRGVLVVEPEQPDTRCFCFRR